MASACDILRVYPYSTAAAAAEVSPAVVDLFDYERVRAIGTLTTAAAAAATAPAVADPLKYEAVLAMYTFSLLLLSLSCCCGPC